MSFLGNIFPSASGTPANGGAAPAVTQAAIPVQATPVAGATPAAPVTPTSPLDQFTKMWENPTTPDGKPQSLPVDPMKAPIFNFDAAKITESANKMDFASSIPPELFTKALGGDAASLADIINQSVRNAVVGLTINQGNLINQALLTNNDRLTAHLPSQINKVKLMEPEDNPVFSHPAAQPLVQSLKQMAFAKDPSANPAAISKQVSDFLMGFATAVHDTSSPQVAQANAAAAGQTDWSKWTV